MSWGCTVQTPEGICAPRGGCEPAGPASTVSGCGRPGLRGRGWKRLRESVGARPPFCGDSPVSVPKDANVRMKCILALKALYEKRESAMKLGLFFHKFKVRDVLRLGCRLLRGISVPVWTGRAAAAGGPGCGTRWSWVPRPLYCEGEPGTSRGVRALGRVARLSLHSGDVRPGLETGCVVCAPPGGRRCADLSIMGAGATRGGPRTRGWLGVGVGPRRCVLDVQRWCAWRRRPVLGGVWDSNWSSTLSASPAGSEQEPGEGRCPAAPHGRVLIEAFPDLGTPEGRSGHVTSRLRKGGRQGEPGHDRVHRLGAQGAPVLQVQGGRGGCCAGPMGSQTLQLQAPGCAGR